MPNISQSVKRKLSMIHAKTNPDMPIEDFIEKISMTDIPKDDYLTKIIHKRAIYEAQHIDENFYCFVCGQKFDHPDDFTLHYQEHLEDFMAGIPIKKTDEHIELQISQLHPKHQDKARKFLKKISKEADAPDR